jgi:hypothetical protein
MNNSQRMRAESNFAALHKIVPAPVTASAEPVVTTSGFDRLKAEAAKRANAKLASEGE